MKRQCIGTRLGPCPERNTTVLTRCGPCTKAQDRLRRPSPTQRGYDAAYRAERLTLIGQPCALALPGCTGVADTADHYAGGLRPACKHCNSADGARRSHGAGPRG